jgi:hypothetical protein
VAPPVTSVEGAVTWGIVRVLVPMTMRLPLEIIVSPPVPVVVRTLVVAIGGDETEDGAEDGGKTVKVWLPVDSVTGAVPVTTGTVIVAVPPMMMTEAELTGGDTPGRVGLTVGGGMPMTVPLHFVRVVVVVAYRNPMSGH